MIELGGIDRIAIPGLQWRMRLLHSIFRPRDLVSIALTNEASTLAVVACDSQYQVGQGSWSAPTVGLGFIALLLSPAARPTASLGAVGELL